MNKFNWKNKKVLVTGSEGFIGSHLVEKLIELGADVRAFVLYNSFNQWGWLDMFDKNKLAAIEVFTGDVRESSNVRKALKEIDIVFHLASLIAIPYSYKSPESYVKTNIGGTINVLQAALEEGCELVIHTSTSETYGTALYAPIDEKHPLQAQSPYAATKIGADKIAESYHKSFDLPVVTCRPFNTYGPRQSARAVIPTIITQIVSGVDAKSIKLGSLFPVRDLTYVEDTVEGLIKAGQCKTCRGEVINLGWGEGISIGELADKIMDLMGVTFNIHTERERKRPDKSEVVKLVCDNTKAKKILGWTPKHSLDEGLAKTIEFIRKNISLYKHDIFNY